MFKRILCYKILLTLFIMNVWSLAPPELEMEQYSGDWLYRVFWDSWCSHFPPETI
jgi:hypothetical protein